MSEQWRGLHNPERHFSAFGTGTPLCDECDDALCVPSNPCYCCLEAEVEVLRAFVPESLRYPKRNGEFINIGPECFSDEEELVICWKGRNYYALDNGTVLPPLPSTPLDQNPVCPACGGTLALERHRVVCLSDEVNHYWYWDGSDD